MEKMKTTPAAPRRSFPPPICSSRSLFQCFCGAPSRERRGIIFIGVFRSKRSRWTKNRRQRSLEGQSGGSHAARYLGRMGPLIWALGPPLVCFSRSQVLFIPNIDVRKFAGHLDVVWVSETLKERNRVFCLRRVNSIKNRKHVKYSQNHYKTVI